MKIFDTAFLLATLLALNMTAPTTAQPTGAPLIIDDNGSHIVLKEMRHQSGPEWRDYGKTVLDYDALGNIIVQQFLTHDGEDSALLRFVASERLFWPLPVICEAPKREQHGVAVNAD